jgi:hypothetical protein
MALGTFWYGPLFGKTFMKALKVTPAMVAKYKKQGMAKEYAIVALASLISTVALACLVDRLGITTAAHGALLGLLVSIGFVSMQAVSTVIFEGRSKTLYWLNAGYQAVLFAIIGALLATWR